MPDCPHCSRANPGDALFCHHDGSPLGDAMRDDPLRRRFLAPFVFPSGRACWTFDELALACQDDWTAAVELLRVGALEAFMGGIGRHDLAASAREAARFFAFAPAGEDRFSGDRALDRFLIDLPATALRPARLSVSPREIDLGRLRVGQNVSRDLLLVNEGMGLLHGAVTSDVPWLVVGEGNVAHSRLFGCVLETTLRVQVRGRALRAGLHPLIGKLRIESSGGRATVTVKAEAPPQTFAAGVLAGARTPRQLAEKARLAPRESARLFETGAVARWYRDNGWSYPVEGESAAGVAGVQQFFDALGLTAPPKLELSESSLSLTGRAGESLHATVRLSTVEKRPVYAQGQSNQPWLVVSGIDLDGSTAEVHLSIPAVPDRPGETLRAALTITGNGRQRFTVPVSVRVAAGVRKSAGSLPPPLPGRRFPGASGTPEWLPASAQEATQSSSAMLSPELEFSAPSLAAAGAEEPVLTFSTRPARRELPRSAWLVLALLGMLGLVGAAGVLLAVRLTTGNPQRDNSESTIEPGPPAPEEKKQPEKREKQPAGKDGAVPLTPPKVSGKQAVRETRPVVLPPTVNVRPLVSRVGAPPLLVPDFIRREVEVVFCIDTTGSMGKLLQGAKEKIWAICNQIASGKPTPELKVGLVAYRDKGDDYITRVFDLSRDLDSVHSDLLTLQAAGGGDTPESVNQALDDAVNKINWSTDRKTLRMVFLVGDAPPHMDYTDDVKYPVTCKKAVEKGILVNTIQCGLDVDCKRYWRDIAAKAEGAYAAIPQEGGVVAVETPFDAPLAKVGMDLLQTALIYGDAEQKRKGSRMLAAARVLRGPSLADRAAFAAKSKRISPYDLLDAIQTKRTKLEDVKDEELPDQMKVLKTLEERQRFLTEVAARREKLQQEAVELEQKRAAALADERKKRGGIEKSFDLEVLDILRQQAKKYAIDY